MTPPAFFLKFLWACPRIYNGDDDLSLLLVMKEQRWTRTT